MHYAVAANLHESEKKIQQTHFVEAAVSLEMAMDMQTQKPWRHHWPHWDAIINMVGSWEGFEEATGFSSSCLVRCQRNNSAPV